MDEEEFLTWMSELIEGGRYTPEQVSDVLEQRRRFESQREEIEQVYNQLAIGFVAGSAGPLAAPNVPQLLDIAAALYPRQMLYFEPVGYRAF